MIILFFYSISKIGNKKNLVSFYKKVVFILEKIYKNFNSLFRIEFYTIR